MVSNFWLSIYSGYCSAMSCSSLPKQPLWWGSPCHRLHMNSLRYSCYLLTIDHVSTDHWPSVDQLLTDTLVKYRRTIGEVSVKYRWTKIYIGLDTSGTTIDRVSTECRATIVGVSTYYRPLYLPSLDRLSTAISTDRSVDTTHSKHYPHYLHPVILSMTTLYLWISCFITNIYVMIIIISQMPAVTWWQMTVSECKTPMTLFANEPSERRRSDGEAAAE